MVTPTKRREEERREEFGNRDELDTLDLLEEDAAASKRPSWEGGEEREGEEEQQRHEEGEEENGDEVEADANRRGK